MAVRRAAVRFLAACARPFGRDFEVRAGRRRPAATRFRVLTAELCLALRFFAMAV
jgi:hypothetical protein